MQADWYVVWILERARSISLHVVSELQKQTKSCGLLRILIHLDNSPFDLELLLGMMSTRFDNSAMRSCWKEKSSCSKGHETKQRESIEGGDVGSYYQDLDQLTQACAESNPVQINFTSMWQKIKQRLAYSSPFSGSPKPQIRRAQSRFTIGQPSLPSSMKTEHFHDFVVIKCDGWHSWTIGRAQADFIRSLQIHWS